MKIRRVIRSRTESLAAVDKHDLTCAGTGTNAGTACTLSAAAFATPAFPFIHQIAGLM